MFILLQICLFIFYPYDDTNLFEPEQGKETRNQCISTFGAQTNVFQILNRKLQKCVPRNHTIITSSSFGARGRNLHKEGERRSKGRRGEGLGLFPTSYPSPLLLILNQARVGRIDDREFVTLTQTYGDRAFSVAAPKLWNELPLDLRSLDTINLLKKHLKTDLFKKAYNI